MIKSNIPNRRIVTVGKNTYAVNDNDMTAWIVSVHLGRRKRYRVPSSVYIDNLEYTITSIEISALRSRRLQRLVISNTVEFVDDSWIPNLRSLYFGTSVQTICPWFFSYYQHQHPNVIMVDKASPHLKIQDGLLMSKDGTVLIKGLYPKKIVNIPHGVQHIESYAFWRHKTEEIVFPTTLRKINDSSFAEMPNLRKVVLPEGVEKLVIQCFMDCNSLEYADVPASVTSLENDIFEDCMNLKTLILRSPQCVKCGIMPHYLYPFETCHIKVPEHLVEIYKQDSCWSLFKHIEPI